jgi:2-polyprenyl-6-methoxyphenol hydroxylase-like FAD-dependent oxidoreductase
MMAAGAVRSPIRVWWDGKTIGPVASEVVEPSINLPRKTLDPLLRRMAAETPGVELILGLSLSSVDSLGEDNAKVTLTGASGASMKASARLLVGADGRDSTVAKKVRARAFRSKNGRFNYSPFYSGPPPEAAPAATSWFMSDQWFGAFPTAGGLTGYYLMPTHEHLPEYKRDLEGACLNAISKLPGAPPVEELELAGPIVGRVDMSNQWRNPIGDGYALVGDAALSIDPLYGVGCGWALQTGAMLADAVSPALASGAPAKSALKGYRRTIASQIIPHTLQMAPYSRGGSLNAMERFVMRRAARDSAVEERAITLASRNFPPIGVTRPSEVVKLLRA